MNFRHNAKQLHDCKIVQLSPRLCMVITAGHLTDIRARRIRRHGRKCIASDDGECNI